ncbi:MAG: nucleotidyltransferase substrate binding protein [bacterium]|nr:nucleotidyltransferase substrate binding protein [bacterium]
MNEDIRWKQRFQNYQKSLQMLRQATAIQEPSDTERAGVIQFFEVTFELAWKVLKDYLNQKGHEVKTPRDTIKQAYQNEMIRDGKIWIEALDNRNFSSHMYDEETIMRIDQDIKQKYLPLLNDLNQYLLTILND